MKKNILLAVLLLGFQSAFAQKSLLGLDENNRYIYYQVVDRPGLAADSLGKLALGFVTSSFANKKEKSANDSSIKVRAYFETYSALAFAKHESGRITFELSIECRNNKYRYWITDFVFTPYERDRYGMFVPVVGKDVALENAKIKLDKKELEGYLDQTGTYCQDIGTRLKLYMQLDHHSKIKGSPDQSKKIVTKNW